MLPQRRYDRILDTIRAEGPVEVRALAKLLDVSEATVRRDLSRLHRAGLIERVRGGATLGQGEPPYAQLASREHSDTSEIAAAAAALVRDGDAVLLDAGTTVHEVAVALRGRPVTVVTSSLAVCDELVDDDAIELVLLGGVVRRSHRSLEGFLTEHCLRQVRAQRLFLGASGVRPDGSVLDSTVVGVPVKQAMLRAVDEVVLLAGPTTFPGNGLARVCGPDQVDVLVCRHGTDPAALAVFEEAGCRVVRT